MLTFFNKQTSEKVGHEFSIVSFLFFFTAFFSRFLPKPFPPSSLQGDVKQIAGTRGAFAAVLGDGGVVTWGDRDLVYSGFEKVFEEVFIVVLEWF